MVRAEQTEWLVIEKLYHHLRFRLGAMPRGKDVDPAVYHLAEMYGRQWVQDTKYPVDEGCYCDRYLDTIACAVVPSQALRDSVEKTKSGPALHAVGELEKSLNSTAAIKLNEMSRRQRSFARRKALSHLTWEVSTTILKQLFAATILNPLNPVTIDV